MKKIAMGCWFNLNFGEFLMKKLLSVASLLRELKMRGAFSLRLLVRPLCFVGGLLALCGVSSALAAAGAAPTLQTMASSINKTGATGVKVLSTVATIAGVGFILSSFFKFHQWRNNPQQIQASQGLSLLAIGAALTLFPYFINIGAQAVLGQSAVKIGGSAMANIVGGAAA